MPVYWDIDYKSSTKSYNSLEYTSNEAWLCIKRTGGGRAYTITAECEATVSGTVSEGYGGGENCSGSMKHTPSVYLGPNEDEACGLIYEAACSSVTASCTGVSLVPQ